jgi:hypothetical protein
MSWNVVLPDKARRKIQLQAVMYCGAFLMFISLLVDCIAVLGSPLSSENRIFGVFFCSFLICFIFLVGWHFLLFAMHVVQVSEQDGVLTLHRAFAPSIRILTSYKWSSMEYAVPTLLDPPFCNRGTLFRCGLMLFYISEYIPNARKLTDAFLSNNFSHKP